MSDSASIRSVFGPFLLATIGIVSSFAQTSAPGPAIAIEPVAAIVDAFRSHSVVAVMAGHGEARGYAFGLSLIHDPRFVAVVNDIVIEEGSARYQDVSDRFVRGEKVTDESLSQIWRNTTHPGLGLDRPWEAFFHAVRDINSSLPPERQLRVLLGDPPIDWDNVRTPQDYDKWLEQRDTFPADLIQREVLAKGRRALLTYGQMHFQRKNLVANYESEGPAATIVSRLESRTGTKVFTIWTSPDLAKLQPDVARWPVPSIAIVRGTVLGAADFTFYYPSEAMGRIPIRDGKPAFSHPIPRDQWRRLRAEDQFEAVLYPGPEPSAEVTPSVERCADKADINEHLRRMAVGGPPPLADELKEFCAAAAPK